MINRKFVRMPDLPGSREIFSSSCASSLNRKIVAGNDFYYHSAALKEKLI
jgi:hypothetical protein